MKRRRISPRAAFAAFASMVGDSEGPARTPIPSRIARASFLAGVLGLGVLGAAPPVWPATALTACATLSSPGEYMLTTNLVVLGTCFVVAADHVVLDLHGHKLTGNGSGKGITDNGGGPRTGVIVSHGTITGFFEGINLLNSGGVTIRDVQVLASVGDGISTGTPATVTGTRSSDNGGSGILLNAPEPAVVSKSQAHRNGEYGIFVGGPGSTVISSSAGGNGFAGIFINAERGAVSGSVADGNTAAGIAINGPSSGVVASRADGNGDEGIIIMGAGATVTNSRADHNEGSGITVVGSSSTVVASRAGGNRVGIVVLGSLSSVSDVVANANVLQGVVVTCPTNVVRATALNNPSANLVEDTALGTCTNFGNNAP